MKACVRMKNFQHVPECRNNNLLKYSETLIVTLMMALIFNLINGQICDRTNYVICPSIGFLNMSWNTTKITKMICVPSKDSDQPEHLPSLIRVFAVRSVGSQWPNASSCGSPGLSESLLGAQVTLLVMLCSVSLVCSSPRTRRRTLSR